MKLFIMQFTPFSCYFLSFKSRFFISALFSNILNLCFLFNVRKPTLFCFLLLYTVRLCFRLHVMHRCQRSCRTFQGTNQQESLQPLVEYGIINKCKTGVISSRQGSDQVNNSYKCAFISCAKSVIPRNESCNYESYFYDSVLFLSQCICFTRSQTKRIL